MKRENNSSTDESEIHSERTCTDLRSNQTLFRMTSLNGPVIIVAITNGRTLMLIHITLEEVIHSKNIDLRLDGD